jgi:hypothetical protein
MKEYYFNDTMRISAVSVKKVNKEDSGLQAANLKNLNIEFNDSVTA